MLLKIRKFTLFCVVAAIAWFFVKDPLQEVLFIGGPHTIIFMPFVSFGLPNFVFFLCAGIALGAIMEEGLAKWAGMAIGVFCLGQVGYSIVFTHSITYNRMGFLIMTAPFVGIILGILLGVGVAWSWRRGLREPRPAL